MIEVGLQPLCQQHVEKVLTLPVRSFVAMFHPNLFSFFFSFLNPLDGETNEHLTGHAKSWLSERILSIMVTMKKRSLC